MVVYFCTFQFSFYEKETTLKEYTTIQILFAMKMMAKQTNTGTWCIAVLSRSENQLQVLIILYLYSAISMALQ